ncbi:ATP-dependent endonuclease [Sulfurovum sp. zt1-1]|uniref:ATP-dependent endonuclease n=1 Tax=Sulfurovum zhangzhouensis TaxID=3019067 RepID=A0ABT7QVB4_9BACT|nr:ATP-dependent endonuclease [Sulfurovum zhangzhouensis]MDM5270775.1 ATP-dependent endonuclease [Sulfurovum zhangzhouensis]
MKIKKIDVNNYRLLKNFSLDLEDELSLVIGKNNSGKTSLLVVLNKFLNNGNFTSNDFNLDYKKEILKFMIEGIPAENDYLLDGIRLRLHIEYNESDDLSNISNLMMDLDEANNEIILDFEYVLTYAKLQQMKTDFDAYTVFTGTEEDKFNSFFKNEFDEYFDHTQKSVLLDADHKVEEFIDLKKEGISLKNIINYRFISAKREVSNKDIDKTLSTQTSKIYKKTESTPEQKTAIDNFKKTLLDTDNVLDSNYQIIFGDVVEKVKKFGGIKEGESNITVHSTLQHRELLDGNTTVMYSHEGDSLPEHYNGLGYMNLISMIFEIEMLLIDFKRTLDEKPADINLLFIEEPEAHTHPQMQYIFIKNIKSLLADGIKRQDEINRELQYIISTHSSHIVSESNFDDIKYLQRLNNQNSVISKNLKDLEKEYEANREEETYRFLKQYLTLNRAELFFADKAILIEGDTERILLPTMMKKIDEESSPEDEKLLSQNISIVEVGAHSKLFESFIDFIGVKTLIITDIDSGKEVMVDGRRTIQACRVAEAEAIETSNSSLKYFFGSSNLSDYVDRELNNKILVKNSETKVWELKEDGFVLIVYQTKEKDSDNIEYHARSFEDSFSHINKNFMKNDSNTFSSLTKKWLKKFKDDDIDCYDFAEKAVTKKPPLAIEILMNSNRTPTDGDDIVTWDIPSYIKEGLIWLRDN